MIFAAFAADVPWYPNSTERETVAGEAPERAQSDRNARNVSRVTSHTQGGACKVFAVRRATPRPCFAPCERVVILCIPSRFVRTSTRVGHDEENQQAWTSMRWCG